MVEPKSKEQNAEMLGFLVKDILHQHRKVVEQALGNIGLHHSQPRILFTIKHLKGASQKEIADHLKVSPASLATSLKRLEKAGFLARTIDEADQRINKIFLTDKGIEAIDVCRQVMHDVDHLMQRDLSETERRVVFELLHKVNHSLETAKLDETSEPGLKQGLE